VGARIGPAEQASIAPDVLDRIIHASSLFSAELRDIPAKAERF
jgi:hypothetical protein